MLPKCIFEEKDHMNELSSIIIKLTTKKIIELVAISSV